MKFGIQYEYQKIPEWYIHYMDYEALKNFVSKFKRLSLLSMSKFISHIIRLRHSFQSLCQLISE